MARETQSKPRLVPVSEIPRSTRRSIYIELVDEFAKSDAKNAKIEGIKPSAAVSVKKAVESLKVSGVSVLTVNGEIYLSKK